jgi:hypothetical protein
MQMMSGLITAFIITSDGRPCFHILCFHILCFHKSPAQS